MKPAIGILLAFAMSACVIEEGGDDPDWIDDESEGSGSSSSTYSNRVKLECNGSVLVDRTFTVRAECESFRSSNSFYCSGIMLPFGC